MSIQFDGILIGSFKIYFYGILIMLGAMAATWLAGRQAKLTGQDSEMAWDILPWALIGGIIGARLWHILFPPASMVAMGTTTMFYLTHPLDALNLRKGGLGIPGAVVGGLIAVWIYCRVKKIPLGPWADATAPGLALAQAVGRWGNFFNQEVYGSPTDLPWKLFIDPAHRLSGYLSVAYYHPLFFYEFIWNLANMALLLVLSRRLSNWLKTWDLFLIYALVYGIGRFGLEFLRLDPAPLGTLNVNQAIMLGVAVFSAIVLIIRHRRPASNL
jgi:phosphatidylglycerol:prolipoprotein diacylglycerol transferase